MNFFRLFFISVHKVPSLDKVLLSQSAKSEIVDDKQIETNKLLANEKSYVKKTQKSASEFEWCCDKSEKKVALLIEGRSNKWRN